MVCSLRMKRILSAALGSLILSGAVMTDDSHARSRQAIQATAPLGIVSAQMNPDGSGLSIQANRPFTGNETRDFSILRLPYPHRLLLEIPNARLMGTANVIQVNRNGVDRIEMSEQRSPFYNAVRVSVYVTDGQLLSRMNPVFEGNALKVDGLAQVAMTPEQMNPPKPVAKLAARPANPAAKPLSPVTKPSPAISLSPAPVLQTPVAMPLAATQSSVLGNPLPGTSVIEDVTLKDSRLVIRGNAGSDLHVKNRFMLTAPTRLVLDIDNAVLAHRGLLAPLNGNSNEIRQIRVGQFDDKTVRIVIETSTPDLFEAFYTGSEKNLLAISPYEGSSITKLSSNTRLGQLESIDLKRDGGATVLRLTASTPIVHRFFKRDNRITLDLLNEAAHPSAISFDPNQYPEIEKMRLEPLTDGQPNSKLSIHLTNSAIQATPRLSEDGRMLEILLSDRGSADAGIIPILSNIGLGTGRTAPFPARIVVDAGHGGKDRGANRSGVNEKDLNLSLATMVRDALVAKGFKVYMTRSTDVFLPLPEITAITNRIKPDLFISIHHNASVNPSMHGIETYYYTPQSLALAKRVHAQEINAVGVRDGGVKKAMFYVIHHTNVPAILCEVGYVSNPGELADLQSQERKSKTARAISEGVIDYLQARVSAKAR